MTLFFTADLHLGHARICTLAERPFASVVEHDEELIRRWNDWVGWDDEVWILGDLFLGPWPRGLENAARLHGRKYLVPGNHDRMFGEQAPEKRRRWIDRYQAAGVSLLPVTGVILDERWVVVSHFPYVGDSQDVERFADQRPVDQGHYLLHGHVHSAWKVNGRQINVGVDAWDYRPVAEGELIPLLAGPP